MANIAAGYITIYRSLFDHDIWADREPFDKRSAWIDLIQMAYYRDSQIIDGMQLIEVKRGSFITSKKKLAERWNWSRKKVDRFLSLLESDHMVVQKSTNKWTMITLCNYCDLNDLGTTDAHQMHIKSASKAHKRNKVNKEIKEKCIYGKLDNVELSDAEYKDIESTYANVNALIDKVSIWLGNNYRANHYATVLQFAENDNWPKRLKQTVLPDMTVDSVPMPDEIKEKISKLF